MSIQVLAENLADRSTELRSYAIEVFNEDSFINAFVSDSEKSTIPENGIDALSEPVRAEIEKLLVTELEDSDETNSLGGIYPYEQRLCDKAGVLLAAYWPSKYIFNLSTGLKSRELQRIECINVWRKSRGIQEREISVLQTIAEHPNKVVEVSFTRNIRILN